MLSYHFRCYQEECICGRQTVDVRCTTDVIVGRLQSFLRCWPKSVESATYVNPYYISRLSRAI